MAKNPKKWSRESLEVIIKAYEEHECLYNIKNKDYFNREKNRNAIDAILNKLKELRPKTTADELKHKLRVLRVQFIQEYKKSQSLYKIGTGTDDVYIPKVWWYKRLLFLRNHVELRKSITKCNISQPNDTEIEELNDNVENSDEDVDITIPTCHITSSKENGLNDNDPVLSEFYQHPYLYTAIIDILNKITSKIQEPKEVNQWSSFGNFVADSLTNIKNKSIALKMKHDILKIIIEAENKDTE